MFFKNLHVYQLAAGWEMAPGTLEAALSKMPLTPCTGLSTLSRGWVPPYGDQGLVQSYEKHMLIALGVEQKVLPTSVIKQELKLRAVDLEKAQGYKPGKKQMRDLAERITVELLPRAFSKQRVTRAWIDVQNGYIVVDASTAGRCEELLEHLRNTLGELPVMRLETKMSPQSAMTQWLSAGDSPGHFAMDSNCDLKGLGEEASAVRYTRHDLSVKEIRDHIGGGKVATRLSLLWRDRISLTLTEPMAMIKVKFLAMQAESDPSQTDFRSAEEIFEADFALMTGAYVEVIKDMIAALGGKEAAA